MSCTESLRFWENLEYVVLAMALYIPDGLTGVKDCILAYSVTLWDDLAGEMRYTRFSKAHQLDLSIIDSMERRNDHYYAEDAWFQSNHAFLLG